MTVQHGPLFRPFEHKTLKLRNRIAMAPMTRLASPGGVPTAAMAAYYERRALGGVGLVISEGTVVDRPSSSTGWPQIPRFHGEAPLKMWKSVVEKVHHAGAAMAPQIWHMGVQADNPEGPVGLPEAEGPSRFYAPGKANGRAMTVADIEATVEAFARSARHAKDLGCDSVEIHAAHGYLIDQFFWDATNDRTDRYGGGTIAERSRFALEIVKAVREAVGPDFAVILRLSQWKESDFKVKLAHNPSELESWLTPLAAAGVDIFHCSQRRYWEPEYEGSDLNLAGWAKKITGCPTITVGSVGLQGDDWGKPAAGDARSKGDDAKLRALDDLLERLDRGEFDVVAVGRALITNPEWAAMVQDGRFDQLKGYDVEDLRRIA
ncbi:NADH:flavin oxidoreductase [Beijerinckia sp. L45]|uniref:NADH:flavin oxidoreductase n=1 Tax=Beijerinckia sp. L45 TaxID=1641855 RepID=UPI00131BFA7A|nr:NADH:flavin oxidoreductase [Beijerinckia sp. L45]